MSRIIVSGVVALLAILTFADSVEAQMGRRNSAWRRNRVWRARYYSPSWDGGVIAAPRWGIFRRRGINFVDASTINTSIIAYSEPASSYNEETASYANEVQLSITLPVAEARLWIQDQVMPGAGTERVFSSPPLEAGRDFVYTIRATWTQDGREVSEEKTLAVTAGQSLVADFGSRPISVASLDNRMLAVEGSAIENRERGPELRD
jgi:uncharacterized protein (TIGR03000 family)